MKVKFINSKQKLVKNNFKDNENVILPNHNYKDAGWVACFSADLPYSQSHSLF